MSTPDLLTRLRDAAAALRQEAQRQLLLADLLERTAAAYREVNPSPTTPITDDIDDPTGFDAGRLNP